MIKREVAVDWPETVKAIRATGMSDPAICEVLARKGVVTCTTSISNIVRRHVREPRYDVGAALLNLLDERTIGRRGNGGSHG